MVIAGGTEAGSPDSICYHLIEKATGANFNYLVFDGADEVNAALLGDNVNVAIGNPGDFMELYKAGKVRLLGSFSEERLAALSDVPTVKEQGIDAVYQLTRGFVLPSGVPAETVAVLEKAIQDYMQTPEWKDYVSTNNLTENYMSGAEFLKFLEESTAMHTEILKEMGVIK
jgi:putative tricarboxylic transport membrane protein